MMGRGVADARTDGMGNAIPSAEFSGSWSYTGLGHERIKDIYDRVEKWVVRELPLGRVRSDRTSTISLVNAMVDDGVSLHEPVILKEAEKAQVAAITVKRTGEKYIAFKRTWKKIKVAPIA